MVEDLNFDLKIIVAPIMRESDGLAMSSRNIYLTPGQRKQAVVLYQSLMHAKELIEQGERQADSVKDQIKSIIEKQPDAKIDYIEIVDTVNLNPLTQLKGEILIGITIIFSKTKTPTLNPIQAVKPVKNIKTSQKIS